MRFRSAAPVSVAKIGYIVLALLSCCMGVLTAAGVISSFALVRYMTGIILLVLGVIKIVGYFSKDLYRLAFQYDLQFGIYLIISGLVIILPAGKDPWVLGIVLGLLFVVESLFRIHTARSSRIFGIKHWWLILAAALFTVAAGLCMIFIPHDDPGIYLRVVGAAVVVDGVMNLCVALLTVNSNPEVINDGSDDGSVFDDHTVQ